MLRDAIFRSGRLAAAASTQYGLFTRDQSRDAGISTSALHRSLQAGAVRSVDYGVYRSATTPTSWEQRLLAACLAGPAVASHRSAAALWSFPGFPRDLVEVTSIRHRRRHQADVLWHESALLFADEITEVESIPVTKPARTIVDLASVLSGSEMVPLVDDAVRRKLTDIDAIRSLVERMGPRRNGFRRMQAVLDSREPGTAVPESVLESEFAVLVERFGLPTPARQHVVTDGERPIARIDFAYVEARVAVEVHGLRYHAGPDQWRADMARNNRLAALGWIIVAFTADDIRNRPDRVAATILSALRQRQGRI